MTEDAMSHHAQVRLQQRAIPPIVVDLLDEFGSRFRSSGAEKVIFDKPAIKRMRRHLGGDRSLRLVKRWLGVYVVIGDDGRLVTVAHRSRRVWRD